MASRRHERVPKPLTDKPAVARGGAAAVTRRIVVIREQGLVVSDYKDKGIIELIIIKGVGSRVG